VATRLSTGSVLTLRVLFRRLSRTLPAAKRAGIAVTTEAKGRSLNSAAAKGRECWACNILERILTLLTADFLPPPFVLRLDFCHPATDYQQKAKLDADNEVKPPEKVDMRWVTLVDSAWDPPRLVAYLPSTSSPATLPASDVRSQRDEQTRRVRMASR
jgi:hypothetical protein